MWTRYRIAKQVIADDLTADGYIISPKVYLMMDKEGSTNTEKTPKCPPKTTTSNADKIHGMAFVAMTCNVAMTFTERYFQIPSCLMIFLI
jgi:K+-sensing histidine kinase KdpD